MGDNTKVLEGTAVVIATGSSSPALCPGLQEVDYGLRVWAGTAFQVTSCASSKRPPRTIRRRAGSKHQLQGARVRIWRPQPRITGVGNSGQLGR